jgi:hypothetical protein
MRSILIMAMFTASLAFAADGYEEVRELSLGTEGIETLSIDAGGGSLTVVGVSGTSEIMVIATIQVDTRTEDKARKTIESDLVLTLEKDSDTAVLKSYFNHKLFGWGDSPLIQLEVRMPEGLNLEIDDGSGPLEVSNVGGDLSINDGSGSIKVRGVAGSVIVDDGSGGIDVSDVDEDLIIVDDGSGGLNFSNIGGRVEKES